MTVSTAMKKRYISAPHRCLFCMSDQIEGESFDTGDGTVYQEVHCNDCGASWTDLYKLVNIRDVEEPDDQSVIVPTTKTRVKVATKHNREKRNQDTGLGGMR